MENKLPKRKVTRWKDFDYNDDCAYFVTICTENRRCILSYIVGTGVLDCPEIQLTEHGKIAEKYIHQLNEFYENISVEDYVIMPNHIHLLLFVNEKMKPVESNLANVIRANTAFSLFISTFKRFCNKEYGKNIWQSRSYDHVIRNEEDYNRHLKYISDNPENWFYDKLYVEE